MAHLKLTSAATIPTLRAGWTRPAAATSQAPSRDRRDVIGWLLWKSRKPAGGVKVKTMPAFVPTGDRPPDELVAELERLQAEQIACGARPTACRFIS